MSRRSVGEIQRSELLGGSSDGSVGQGELEILLVVLGGLNSLAVLVGNSGGSDNLDGREASSVSASHVVI